MCEMTGNGLGAGAKCNGTFKIVGLIFFIRDRPTIAVEFILAGTPACGIPIGDDAMNAIRREETIVNTLTEAILKNGITEIQVGVAIIITQRRGGHAELDCRSEVIEDHAPRAVFAGTASVALVHNDQVEEIGWELAEEPFAAFVLGHGLIDAEIHLPTMDNLAILDLVAGIAKGGKDSVFRLVDQDIAVGKVKNAWLMMDSSKVPAAFHSFQQIWNATSVLPVPVAMVSKRRLRLPSSTASTVRLMAIC